MSDFGGRFLGDFLPFSFDLRLASIGGGAPLVDVMRTAFGAWMDAEALGPSGSTVVGIPFNFYAIGTDAARWIYPRLAAEKILWHLARGEVTAAQTLATTLLTWQVTAPGIALGAFPSLITYSGGTWIAAGDLDGTGSPAYYSGDGLVILTALCALYTATADDGYRIAAYDLGDWLLSMIDAPNTWLTSFGFGGPAYPAPFMFVTASGAMSDRLIASESYNYIGALTLLSFITGDSAYGARVAGARAFYSDSQHADGYWLDHYTAWPNYPAAPPAYNAANWEKFNAVNNTIIADNNMNSALGALKAGDTLSASAFFTWMLPAVDQSGGVPGYLACGATGAHGFGVGDVYYDVVSSGQWRSICQWLGETALAVQAVRFIEAAQHANGGWRWGILQRLGLSATGASDDQAPHTGFWCTEDLSVYATALVPAIAYSALIPTRFVVSVEVTPAGVNIAPGTQQFTATATYSDASTAVVTTGVYWHCDDASKMTLAQTGLGTTVAPGAANVYATLGEQNDPAFIVVDP